MGQEYNLNVSLTVVQNAFRDSLGDGLRAIGEEINNAFSRGREILDPNKPFPDLEYQIVNNRLHWAGDQLSVVHHLRRYIVWLSANNGTDVQLNQARMDLAVFREVERRSFGLREGEALFWLAQRTPEPSEGVALQQIRKQGDKLIQTSQLLPFDQTWQIDNFRDQVGTNRDNVSVDDSIGGWIVEGESLNFVEDLPVIVEQAQRQSELLPETTIPIYERFASFPQLPINRLIGNKGSETTVIKPALPEIIPVSETTGFWFEAMTAAAEPADTSGSEPEVLQLTTTIVRSIVAGESKSSEPLRSDFEAAEASTPKSELTRLVSTVVGTGRVELQSLKPTRTNPVGKAKTSRMISQSKEEKKPLVVNKAPERRRITETTPKKLGVDKQTTIVGKISTLLTKELKTNTSVNRLIKPGQKRAPRAEKTLPKTSGRVSEVRPIVISEDKQPVKPAGTVFEGKLPVIPEGQKPSGRVPEGGDTVSQEKRPEQEIPVWEAVSQSLNDKEIPFWQPTVLAFAPDYTIYILTFLFALSNTNLVHLEFERGRGAPPRRAVVYAS